MKIVEAESVETVKRERERATLYSKWNLLTLRRTDVFIQKEIAKYTKQ